MTNIEMLRLMLGVLALVVLVLFFIGVYRPTRSPFAGWWSLGLACTVISPTLLLANGTAFQVFTNPLASAFATLGCVCVWFATRHLRGRAPRYWALWVAPVLVVVAALFDNPGSNKWAGNGVLFLMMTVLFALGAREMWLARRVRARAADSDHDGEALVSLFVAALGSSVLTVFYAWRVVVFISAGPGTDVFRVSAGTVPTTMTLMVVLTAVTFSIVTLGYDDQTRELRQRVSRDDLTGLLARAAFYERAAHRIATRDAVGAASLVVVVADLDHFKEINDVHGHAAGDRALVLFGQCVMQRMDDGELAGRLGGEEFAILLHGRGPEGAVAWLHDLVADYEGRGVADAIAVPTVSFGVADAPARGSLERSLARADVAMYRAKSAGRARVVLDPELADSDAIGEYHQSEGA